ncbi:MAG: hypothetical protein WAV90_22210 [Gordonia amarae]
MSDTDWPIPSGLCPAGRKAAETLRDFFVEKRIADHGGGGRFYSPAQWREREELYGLGSVLIVTHDGGAHADAFYPDGAPWALHEALIERLNSRGFWYEVCTNWYSAVYLR